MAFSAGFGDFRSGTLVKTCQDLSRLVDIDLLYSARSEVKHHFTVTALCTWEIGLTTRL